MENVKRPKRLKNSLPERLILSRKNAPNISLKKANGESITLQNNKKIALFIQTPEFFFIGEIYEEMPNVS